MAKQDIARAQNYFQSEGLPESHFQDKSFFPSRDDWYHRSVMLLPPEFSETLALSTSHFCLTLNLVTKSGKESVIRN